MDQSTYSSSEKLSLDNLRSKTESPVFKFSMILAGLIVWIALCLQSDITAKAQMISSGVIVACLMTLRAFSSPLKNTRSGKDK
ncbi:hypothetical protein AB2B38_002930 [Balneola sp. MJW-20]|uniref:hypothetical protein n=1 Tax=Gracilimonas aurantiaca TaxID=3234185 RepID=UPI0034662003